MTAALVLAAGRGTRMKSERLKVLHEVCGRPMLARVLDIVRKTGVRKIGVVVGLDQNGFGSLLDGVTKIVQKEQLGTAHAVLQAEKTFRGFRGKILVVPGDAPCLTLHTVRGLIAAHEKNGEVATILTALVEDPKGYGRILRAGDTVLGIREELDASEEERKINEVNSGVYLFDAEQLFLYLKHIRQNGLKKEYYLTDVIEALVRDGKIVSAYTTNDSDEIMGINTREHLAKACQVLTDREIKKHQNAGVTIIAPEQTFIAPNVTIGQDTVIHPFTWIERDVKIGRRCEVGPFAKIREESTIQDDAVIGSFVEIVRSQVGSKTFVKHLSYIGDSKVGKAVNVGAGTVVANFDGKNKNRSVIEDGVFLGCNTVLIAPAKVGKGAKTGAGAVVCANKKVPAGQTFVGVPAKAIQKSKRKK